MWGHFHICCCMAHWRFWRGVASLCLVCITPLVAFLIPPHRHPFLSLLKYSGPAHEMVSAYLVFLSFPHALFRTVITHKQRRHICAGIVRKIMLISAPSNNGVALTWGVGNLIGCYSTAFWKIVPSIKSVSRSIFSKGRHFFVWRQRHKIRAEDESR